MKKNKQAQAMARLRWKGKTKEERSAHAKMMSLKAQEKRLKTLTAQKAI